MSAHTLPPTTCLHLTICRSWAADHPGHFIALYGVARSNQLYLLIYMALVLLFVGLLLTRDSVFSMWSIRASTQLHNRKFSRLCLGERRMPHACTKSCSVSS